MRNPRNETAERLTISPPLKGGGKGAGSAVERHMPDATQRSAPTPFLPKRRQQAPERTCVLTHIKGTKDELIRLALGPDGTIAPDVRARAPGRGAWIGVSRSELDRANSKGKLKPALQRAFKTNDVQLPADLGERTEAALRQAALDRLGMEARAGNLINGSDKIENAARSGKVALLIHAADAGDDGRKKLDQAWRVSGGRPQGVIFPEPRTILSMALGRDNVVHIALTDPAAASRVVHALARWLAFTGPERGLEGGEPALGLGSAEENLAKE